MRYEYHEQHAVFLGSDDGYEGEGTFSGCGSSGEAPTHGDGKILVRMSYDNRKSDHQSAWLTRGPACAEGVDIHGSDWMPTASRNVLGGICGAVVSMRSGCYWIQPRL